MTLCECGCGGSPRSGRRFIQHHHLRKHGNFVGLDQRGISLIRNYGLHPDEYDRMFADQMGACAICHQQTTRPLSVDHDHETGQIRGLLCVRCNSCLGWFERHGPRAVGYLAAFQEIPLG